MANPDRETGAQTSIAAQDANWNRAFQSEYHGVPVALILDAKLRQVNAEKKPMKTDEEKLEDLGIILD